ncbi:MAG: hypothetical protein AAGF74_02230 [Pseudomonadota bacterium]
MGPNVLARLPFTVIFVAIMVLANAAAGTLGGVLPDGALSDWGISHQSVREGEVHRLFTGTFLSHDLGMFLRQLVFAAAVIGLYEWTEGTRRAVIMFLAIDLAGTLLVLFGVLPALVAMHPEMDGTALSVLDVGMSAGGFGLIGALAAQRPRRWFYLVIICLAIGIKVWISFDAIADSAHLLCLFLGFAAQGAVDARARKRDVAQG